MKNKQFIESYKGLCKTTIALALMVTLLHLVATIGLSYVTGGAIGKGIAAVFVLHVSYIKFIPMYIENFKYLVQKQVINNSKKLFWYGMLPFIIGEVLNIAVLVLVLCL